MTATAAGLDQSAEFLDPELSLLAFQRRVLALAEDRRVPLVERLRFLGIVTSNLDELYMLRMAELRRVAVADSSGGAATAKLEIVEAEVRDIMHGQWVAAAQCLEEAALRGVRVRYWEQLDVSQQTALQDILLRDIQPSLRSHAITYSPGYPVPHLPHLGLFVAVAYREHPAARLRLAEHELPNDMPRLLPVPGTASEVIPLESMLRANVQLLYPDPHVQVESVHLFRVTRGGDLRLDDDPMSDLLGAVERAAALRPLNPAVRVEVESDTPKQVCDLIVHALLKEAEGRDMALTVTEVQRVGGLLDLRCLAALPIPDDGVSEYPPLIACRVFHPAATIYEQLRDGDVLAHHPFDDFDDSVSRFFEEAAVDPSVTAIDVTLYRVGTPSRVAEALRHAAERGIRVFALIELQARFDEEHNTRWARALERAGGQVVYGLPGLKVHAKAALITRIEDGEVRRSAHVGTGNYNSRSGRQYTDLSLFSSRAPLTQDLQALFASLAGSQTGTPHAPPRLPHAALVAPHQLRTALLQRIERETLHARSGKAASLTFKVNALADQEMAQAIRAAVDAGVRVTLIVRGICILRPRASDTGEHLTIISVVGRFLEHSRIYRFENGGSPEYLIGSSDLRPRNLRRRVELLVPVEDASGQALLASLLARYATDPSAWTLESDGQYRQRQQPGRSAQEQCVEDARLRAKEHESPTA